MNHYKYLQMCALAASISGAQVATAQPQDAGQPRAGIPLTPEQAAEFQQKQRAELKERQEAAEAAERRTPAGSLQQFATALNTGDIALAERLVLGGRPGHAQQLEGGLSPWRFGIFPLAADAPEGKDEFEARVVVFFMRSDPLEVTDNYLLSTKMSFIEAVTLRRGDDGEWKIVPRPAPPAFLNVKGANLQEQIAAIKAMSVQEQIASLEANIKAAQSESDGFLNTWARTLSQPRVPNLQVASRISMSNLKQILLGMLQFAQDYDQKLLFTPANFAEKLQPYTKSRKIFLAPTLDQNDPFAYTLNPEVAGKSLGAFAQPSRTAAIYEADKDGKLLFRFDGKAVIGFVDGHVKLTSPEEAEKLMWKP
jgi:prepilin-type processing-associated H-X9-DG protein